MKSLHATVYILGALICTAANAQQTASLPSNQRDAPRVAANQDDTPAQLRIAAAGKQLKSDPKKVQAYNELAIGFLTRARETADPKYLKDADAALAQGLSLDAANFQLLRTQVALLLSRDELAQAKARARVLNHRTPDDVLTYGYLAEADIALGNYPEAETNAQWMLNLRPNNIPALLIGAKLRSLYGDEHGAMDFLRLAFSETYPTEVEDLAWIANQIASIQIESGQNDDAQQTLEQAEQVFPRYPHTIENLARVRMGQNRPNDALQLWMQAALIDRDPHILYALARAQDSAGQSNKALASYAEFEKLASDPASSTHGSRLDLILMYAGSSGRAPRALTLAQQEIAARADVWTQDAYAWALHANGRYQEAEVIIQKALAVGIQSAQIFDHAAHIAQKLNHAADARRYFLLSLQSNAFSEYASDARNSMSEAVVGGEAATASPRPATVVAPPAEVLRDPAPDADRSEHSGPSVRVGATVIAPVFQHTSP
jgi:tetratricopeptide (TPR) repeat protein